MSDQPSDVPDAEIKPEDTASDKPQDTAHKPLDTVFDKPQNNVSEKPHMAALDKPETNPSDKPETTISDKPQTIASDKLQITSDNKPQESQTTVFDKLQITSDNKPQESQTTVFDKLQITSDNKPQESQTTVFDKLLKNLQQPGGESPAQDKQGGGDDDEREEAFRTIVENAQVDVVPPASGKTAHARSFRDYFMAKLNKTKIIDFPSWDSPQQSPEFNLYVAKSELIKVTHELTRTRTDDVRNRSQLTEHTRQLETKQAEFSQLIVDTEPFIQQNREIRARFQRIISRNEAKVKALQEKTEILRRDASKFTKWEMFMRALVDKYAPYQEYVAACLRQSSGEITDITSLLSTYVSKLYAKYNLLAQLYSDVHSIDATQHDLRRKISRHSEELKGLTDTTSGLRVEYRELTAEKHLLEKQRALLHREKETASYECSEVQKNLDNAYKLFILDAPSGQKPSVKQDAKKPTNEEKVSQLQLQHDYLTEVLKVATRLYEMSDDTLRGHVSMETIRY
ncbi:hypothetical protein M8J77_016007 [Diaphorina citri]|nr:hypothetical protein M8J77_016007 [Diaphorina citri]